MTNHRKRWPAFLRSDPNVLQVEDFCFVSAKPQKESQRELECLCAAHLPPDAKVCGFCFSSVFFVVFFHGPCLFAPPVVVSVLSEGFCCVFVCLLFCIEFVFFCMGLVGLLLPVFPGILFVSRVCLLVRL